MSSLSLLMFQATADDRLLYIPGRLHLATLRNVVEAMVAAGSAEYDPPKAAKGQLPSAVLVFWRKPEEWANIIYDWVSSTSPRSSLFDPR